jgi:hypothetical protein
MPIKGGREIMAIIGVRTILLLRNTHKNPPIHLPCDLPWLVHDKFCLVFYNK